MAARKKTPSASRRKGVKVRVQRRPGLSTKAGAGGAGRRGRENQDEKMLSRERNPTTADRLLARARAAVDAGKKSQAKRVARAVAAQKRVDKLASAKRKATRKKK